jgi:hypothetical protein
MLTLAIPIPSLDETARIIQTALTPVFLLAGVANLLAVFATRLARIADRVDYIAAALAKATPEEQRLLMIGYRYLQRRSHLLDAAVVLGAIGGAATCGAALILFIGALHNSEGTASMLILFGVALLSTVGALIAFLIEVLIANRHMRGEIAGRYHVPPGR